MHISHAYFHFSVRLTLRIDFDVMSLQSTAVTLFTIDKLTDGRNIEMEGHDSRDNVLWVMPFLPPKRYLDFFCGFRGGRLCFRQIMKPLIKIPEETELIFQKFAPRNPISLTLIREFVTTLVKFSNKTETFNFDLLIQMTTRCLVTNRAAQKQSRWSELTCLQ